MGRGRARAAAVEGRQRRGREPARVLVVRARGLHGGVERTAALARRRTECAHGVLSGLGARRGRRRARRDLRVAGGGAPGSIARLGALGARGGVPEDLAACARHSGAEGRAGRLARFTRAAVAAAAARAAT